MGEDGRRYRRTRAEARNGPDPDLDLMRHVEALVPREPLSADHPFRASVQTRVKPTPLSIEMHPVFEIGVLLEGAHERLSSEGAVTTAPGDVWLVAMSEPHGWRIARPRTTDLLVIFVPGFLGEETIDSIPWLRFFAAPWDQRPKTGTPMCRKRVLAIAEEMRREIEERLAGWGTGVRLGVLRLLLEVSREWRPPSGSISSGRTAMGNLARIMPAVELARAHPGRRVTLREAAATCSLSLTHFQRTFQSTMGVGFGRFSLHTRIAAVAKHLLTTDMSEEALAHEFGFADASHLRRTFVKLYRCTPGSYRRHAGWSVRERQR